MPKRGALEAGAPVDEARSSPRIEDRIEDTDVGKTEDDAEEANDVADLSEHAEELEQEKKASRFGDHYFAFFLTCTRPRPVP